MELALPKPGSVLKKYSAVAMFDVLPDAGSTVT